MHCDPAMRLRGPSASVPVYDSSVRIVAAMLAQGIAQRWRYDLWREHRLTWTVIAQSSSGFPYRIRLAMRMLGRRCSVPGSPGRRPCDLALWFFVLYGPLKAWPGDIVVGAGVLLSCQIVDSRKLLGLRQPRQASLGCKGHGFGLLNHFRYAPSVHLPFVLMFK